MLQPIPEHHRLSKGGTSQYDNHTESAEKNSCIDSCNPSVACEVMLPTTGVHASTYLHQPDILQAA